MLVDLCLSLASSVNVYQLTKARSCDISAEQWKQDLSLSSYMVERAIM